MHKPLAALAALAVCAAAPVLAQTDPVTPQATTPEAAAPAPVETLTCDQMQAEMTVAGQRMQAQLDPNFATEAQAMQSDAQRRQQQAMTGAVGNAALCMIPGIGITCAVSQQAQAANARTEAARNEARMQAQMDRLDASMEGTDLQRMEAINQRWGAQHCQPPQ